MYGKKGFIVFRLEEWEENWQDKEGKIVDARSGSVIDQARSEAWKISANDWVHGAAARVS